MFQLVERVDGRRPVGQPAPAVLALAVPRSRPPGWTRPAFARTPVVVYGVNLLLAAVAYYVLQLVIIRAEGGSGLRQALGRDLKGKLSPFLYLSGIALAFVGPWLGELLFTTVAIIWLVPDRRVERYLAAQESS